jgi:hypothetical protein
MSRSVGKSTKPVAFRLSNEVYAILERRVLKHPRHIRISDYLRERVIYDLTRGHNKGGK